MIMVWFYVASCFVCFYLLKKQNVMDMVGTHERRPGPQAPEHMWMLAPLLALGREIAGILQALLAFHGYNDFNTWVTW